MHSGFLTRLLQFSILTTLALVLTMPKAVSQKRMTYDSAYQALPAFFGNAKFSYYLDKKKHPVKDGDFQFTRTERDSSCQNQFLYHEWEGTFRDGQKIGSWQYQKHLHSVNVTDANYGDATFQVASQLSQINGGYREGFPEGRWEYKLNDYEGKKIVSQPEIGEISFFQGQADGEVMFIEKSDDGEDTIQYLAGKAQKGLLEGAWEIHYKASKEDTVNTKETRIYKQGILKQLVKVYEGDTLIDLTFPLSPMLQDFANGKYPEKGELVNRPLSFAFNDGYPRESDWVTSQVRGNQLLKQFSEYFSYYHPDILAEKGLIMGTNRGFYPLKNDEKKASEQWSNSRVGLKNQLLRLQEKGIEHYGYHQDSVLRWIAIWTAQQEKVLEYTEPWVQLIERNEVEFYHRDGVIVEYARSLLNMDSLKINGQYDVIEYESTKNKKEEGKKKHFGFLNYIAQNFGQRLQLADSLSSVFDERVKNLKIKEEIVALKESLIRDKAKLDSIFSQTPGKLPKSLKTILKIAKSDFLESGYPQGFELFLSSYESPNRQKTISDSLHLELEHLENIHTTALSIATKLPKIDSIYTAYKFDPFTFSDRVPFRAQKILYEAAINNVLPFLLDQSQKANRPLTTRQSLQRIDALLEKLVLLRGRSTKSLERKLKKTELPSEQLDFINNF